MRPLRPTNRLIISYGFLLFTAKKANAFHRRMQREAGNGDGDTIYPEKRPRSAFLQSSLRSLARVAERGALKWGHYVSSTQGKATSLKKSSSLYVSQLHQRIQEMQSSGSEDSDRRSSTTIDIDFERRIRKMDEGTAPPEHFSQEILAYMLGGAAAGSAFAAATAGAFLGTALVALGAIIAVQFNDEEEEERLTLMNEEDTATVEYGHHSIREQIIDNEGCDYNGEEQMEYDAEASTPTSKTLPSHKLNTFMLEELKKCHNGIPDYSTLSFPREHSKNVCIVDGDDTLPIHDTIIVNGQQTMSVERADESEHRETEASNLNLASAIEDACSSTKDCDNLTPTVDDVIPKRIEVVWHDAYTGASHYYTRTQSTNKQTRHEQSQPHRALSKRTINSRTGEQSTPDHWAILTDAERDGALLLSESFRVASSAFGLMADAIRFTGETAAATAGGAARLAGGVVRVSGWAVNSLGEAIENGGNSARSDGGDRGLSSSSEGAVATPDGDQKLRTREVAGTSVRLIGDAIEQVADSLLLAGSATERVAFAAAGAAEGTVRIVENFASSVSDMFSKEGRRGTRTGPPLERQLDGEPLLVVNEVSPNIAEEGISSNVDDTHIMTEATLNEVTPIADGSLDGAAIDLFRMISSWAVQNTDLMIAETAGVPSLAPEMLGVFLLCFLASVILLSSKENKKNSTKTIGSLREDGERPKDVSFQDGNKTSSNAMEDHDSRSTLTIESTVKIGPDSVRARTGHSSTSLARRAASPFLFFIFMPPKLARVILVWFWKIVFSKKAILLLIYILGWAFLSRVSQYKSSVIQRKSELIGYKLAIESIGKSPPFITESAVWLNTLLYKLWRVDHGGLEPRISSSAGASLAESLKRPYSKPSMVAHVALESFTFGSTPPIVSSIRLKGVSDKQSVLHMDIDVGMLLHDAVLLLDIKPSSLEYRSLPSTKVSINSLDARATLSLSLHCSPDYPYVSFLDVSLAEIPDFNLRIEPQNESGLKGIDFGSFPVVSKWIKSSISSALAEYLSPRRISIDILAWLKGDEKIVTYIES